ncbi:MAG: DUF5333 domain-containing protein [bacterium]
MLKSWFPSVLVASVLAASVPAMAEAMVPLQDEAHINEQLVAAAAGDILRQTCPSLSARYFVVWSKLTELENYARSKGYTEHDVDLFLKDKSQKARIKATAKEYLANAGVVRGDVESYCAAGRQEIAKETLVGSLLRSSK